jgi:flagellin
MMMQINTNVQSLNAQRLLAKNTMALGKSLEKLASGYRINRASDDAAGLQISEGLRAQIRGSEKARDNVQDGINVLNTADGTLSNVTESLQRMRELTVQGANDTLGAQQRSAINLEMTQLARDIDRIVKATSFNGKGLLDNTVTTFRIQLGSGSVSTTNLLNIGSAAGVLGNTAASTIGILNGAGALQLGVGTTVSARASLSKLDTALLSINNRRAAIGAMTNRLESADRNLAIAVENFSSSESRIRNVDVARESAEMTKNQILQQASSTILSQANSGPNLALSLLRGQ